MTEFITQWHAHLIDIDRIPTILMAIIFCSIIGMITGPLLGNANPFIWRAYDLLFGKLGDRMDRTTRAKPDLIFRGFLVTAFVVFIAACISKAFDELSVLEIASGTVRLVLLSLLLTSGSVWFVLLKLYFAMEKDKVGEGAYYAVARTTRLNLAAGDDFGITRAAMGASAKTFDKGLVAPALWYLIGGFPGACIYSALAMMNWRFGKAGLGPNKGMGFEAIPLALERLAGVIPSLLSALLMTLASTFTPTAKLHKSVAAWLGHKNRAPYEQGGAPVSALAWALNVSLGGAAQDLSGTPLKGEWVGPEGATAQLSHKHLRRAIYINVIAHLLFIASLLGAYMWGGIFQ